jgi:hypothetical protein
MKILPKTDYFMGKNYPQNNAQPQGNIHPYDDEE